ncbi:MAG TPA: hypothetical protein PLJ12_13940 [Planctomycetota bacterium]|nr:hypothetical protein [Planctomycetota bacterium]
MGTRVLVFVLALLLGLGFLFTALDREVADIELRDRITRTPVSKVFQGFPPGQLFRCDFRDLQRIDVRVLRQGNDDGPDLLLELREVPGDQLDRFLTQPVVRSAAMESVAGARGPLWATFRFEPIPASKGKVYHFSLRPAEGRDLTNWAPFVSMRATTGEFLPWGNRLVSEPTLTWDFRSRFSDLSAVAIAVNGLDATAAPSSLQLFELPEGAGVDPTPVLRAEGQLHHQAPIASGYAFYTLDPIANSRWKKYRAVLHLPPGARVLMTDSGPTYIEYHGIGTPPPELIGQTIARDLQPNRDLVFRAYGEDGVRSNWGKLVARGAQGRFVWAWLVWGGAMGLALLTILPRPQATEE